MRILGGKIVTHGKTLYDRSIWAKIAVLRVGDLQFAAFGIKGGKHHPRYEDHVSDNEEPITDA